MLLSNADIARLERKGYTKQFFVQYDKSGYATLRNQQGYCVFYNVEKRRCGVYADRPLGCRVYPVIYDEEKGIVADTVCCSWETVTEKEKAKRGRKVFRLLEKIDSEAEQRHFK